MVSFSGGNKQFNVSLRYKDFFIDFLACLIPGFLFLVLSFTIIASTIFISFKFIPYNGPKILLLPINDLTQLKDLIYFPFWIHVSVFILSYIFGFFLYRQDPKKPDHVSYLRNRKTVKGYNEWVIKKTEGLSQNEVQFPYCNLSAYLSSRGFNYDKTVINWDCEKERGGNQKENHHKNRSKAFINKLKMRISFFYPEALSAIIKNEAHIRFSSSMWYGLSVIIKMLYGTIFFVIVFENLILYKHGFNLSKFLYFDIINILIILISIALIWIKFCENKIFKIYDGERKEYEKNLEDDDHIARIEEYIDNGALKLTKIYKAYDIIPFLGSIAITIVLYISIYFNVFGNIDFSYLLLSDSCLISVFAFFTFYTKQKIEMSFHYQRVREIIYVVEVANMAEVIKDSDIKALLEKRNMGFIPSP